ncbi:MAG TPA: histidinol-phosphate transaminase [Casimicrobiaceae bacterium]|nr:histidinol-phosphate transaminase [Casimicrobiaceae bacterium]
MTRQARQSARADDTRETIVGNAANHAVSRAPEYVRAIAPYVGGKPIEEVARELDLDPASIVKLASNENPRGASPKVKAAIAEALADLTRYPDGNAYALKAVLAARRNVRPEQIVLGNGSNDVLELATHAFLRPGDHAVYSQYAFIVYPLATKARGAAGIEVPARDYGHDLDAMLAAITPKTRMVFVANPNNPTGTWLAGGVVERFVARVPRDVIVVIDEAYAEFLEPSDHSNAIAWIARFPNLIVSHTFSKAHGLAALRVGYGVMDEAIADLLNRVRQPFNVNSLAQAAALAALDDADYVEESRRINREGMRQVEASLRVLGIRFLPSHGNFVLIEVGNAHAVFEKMLRLGVIVRPVANYNLPTWLRVTIGTPHENERFLAALAQSISPSNGTARAH